MAIGLAVLTVLWFKLMGPNLEPVPVDQTQVVDTSDVGKQSEGTVEKSGDVKSLDDPDNKTNSSDSDTKQPDKTPDKQPVVDKEEKFVPLPVETISLGDYSMFIDPQRGITEVDLVKYKNDDRKTDVRIGSTAHPSFYLTGSADSWKMGKPTVSKTDSSIEIRRSVIGMNLDVVQTITLGKDYQFTNNFKFINTGDKPVTLEKLGINCGNMSPLSDNVGMMAGMDQAVDVYDIEEEGVATELFQDILKDSTEMEQSRNLPKGKGSYFLERPVKGFQWISVKNRYFAWIIDKDGGFADCKVGYNFIEKEQQTASEEKEYIHLVTAVGTFNTISIPAGSSQEINLKCYAGPQELGILKKLDYNKKGIMQLNLFMWFKVGWIGFISELMLKALLMLYGFVGNYGVAIILLTIIVKALFWRLTNKSTESMKKMSTLSPMIKEINEKYKDNPQVKNQEIMKLYRENGVNPVAGCLPLLLQMPVFIALFNAFRGSIELRHSEFLWVSDLSQPDTIFDIAGLPIRPLAIAWAVTMLLQQKIVPSTADPTQKKIMMFMPVFMLFVCYGMPSGLTLYWTFSTVMSILQYYLNNKKNASETKEQAAVKKAAAG